MKVIDNFLDTITMYRLVLYFLLLLLGVAVVYCFLGILSYDPISLILSSLFLVAVCVVINKIFSHAFAAPTNVESAYITGLILALILSPAKTVDEMIFLFWAGVVAMASKYILAINKKHIFNPAAIAVTLTSLAAVGYASWWVGTKEMLPFLLLGLLIVRKIRRYALLISFLVTTLLTTIVLSLLQGTNPLTIVTQILLGGTIFFFAFVMLTEPLTTPPTRRLQAIYGIVVGILFAPQLHVGNFNSTSEIALVLGNIFSYLVSPKEKLLLTLKEKLKIGTDLVDFLFNPGKKLSFLPGQYMEWTLPHPHTDSRGNRRYFTIASAPTEETLRLGVRLYPNGSSFKKALTTMDTKTRIVAAGIRGDFTLPTDATKKLVFIAGGIGITPFRSMLKYLVDTKQKRDVVLFYSNKVAGEVVYTDVFTQAQKELGIKTVYTITDETQVEKNWKGKVGRISAAMIQQEVPDFKERTFYLSGPHAMIVAYEDVLKSMGVSGQQIKKDFFPGYA